MVGKAGAYEFETTRSKPVRMEMASRLDLGSMRTTIGATWLDEHLRDHGDDVGARGFGGDVEQASMARRAFLHREGILKEVGDTITDKTLQTLEKRGLAMPPSPSHSSLAKSLRARRHQGVSTGYIRSVLTGQADAMR